MKYCPKCRAEYRDQIAFCTDCNLPLTETVPQIAVSPKIKSITGLNVLGLISGVLALIIGLATIWLVLGMHQYQQKVHSWPIVLGKVAVSQLETYPQGPGKSAYSCKIRYSYVVNGVTHAQKVAFYGTHKFESRAEAENILKKYPLGAPITVSYDPERPQDSSEGVGDDKVAAGMLRVIQMGIFWSLIGIALLILNIILILQRKKKTKTKRSVGVTVFGMYFILSSALGFIGSGIQWESMDWTSRLTVLVMDAIYFVLGVNILKLKEWARKGIILCSVILSLVAAFLLATSWSKMLGLHDKQFMQKVIPIVLAGVTSWIAGVIYFFTRPKVKEQFK